MTNTKGAMIAAALAGMVGCATTGSSAQQAAPSGATTAGVKCLGINSCKGQGQCATADHSCGKHTPCKGQGWLSVPTAEECAAKGGKVAAS